MKPQHQRYPYSAIVDRPSFDWPDGRRVAIYIGVNHVVFHFGEGLGATLAPSQTEPDVMNYAWRDYGNRVGAWRMFDLFDELDLKTTALVNAELVERCPRLVEACRDRGDEIAAHGMTNAEAQGAMDETAERAMIERTTQAHAFLRAALFVVGLDPDRLAPGVAVGVVGRGERSERVGVEGIGGVDVKVAEENLLR